MDQSQHSSKRASRPEARLIDTFGREISYLRLSVTDRCNRRCLYCMGKDVKFLPRADVLTLEEMERLCAAFIRLGVRKLRLTGGEPLLRPGMIGLVRQLGTYVESGALKELTLTTNGTLLAKHATDLVAAGVRRVNVSLDTLDAEAFRRITQRDALSDVLAGIHAARAAKLAVRINIVALPDVSDAEYDRMIRWCGSHGCDMALIELMPFGSSDLSLYQPLDPVRERIGERWTLTPSTLATGGPCRYWHVAETGYRIGFITPRSHGFCASCNRVRVTCTGRLVPCMAQAGDIDLMPALRGSESDEALDAAIVAAVGQKPEGHRFGTTGSAQRMWQMGG